MQMMYERDKNEWEPFTGWTSRAISIENVFEMSVKKIMLH